jgi:hypothetical protein
MERDKRYRITKNLILGGHVKMFREIFDSVPKTRVAKDMGTNYVRLNKLIDYLPGFTLKDFITISELLDVELKVVLDLVANQYAVDKKVKRKK